MSLAAEIGLLDPDISDCIELCSSRVSVTRQAGASKVNSSGWAEDAPTRTFDITISLQPMNQKELKALPEGDRVEGRLKGYTETRLETVNTSECKQPDEFRFQDVNYKVVKVDPWPELANYFRVEAVRLDR